MRAPTYDPGMSAAAVASARLGLFGALLALIALALAGLDKVSLLVALVILGCAALFGLGALGFALRGMVSVWQFGKRGVGMLLAGLLFASMLLAGPVWLGVQAIRLPPLHDISTDTEHPPHFSATAAAVAARGGRTPGDASASDRAQQLSAYPDVQPILVDVTPRRAYELAQSAVKALHWTMIATKAAARHDTTYRIDATHQMSVLHFVEDITIRIEPADSQARIDIRSASRTRWPDFGTNAALIQKFIDEYQKLVDNLG